MRAGRLRSMGVANQGNASAFLTTWQATIADGVNRQRRLDTTPTTIIRHRLRPRWPPNVGCETGPVRQNRLRSVIAGPGRASPNWQGRILRHGNAAKPVPRLNGQSPRKDPATSVAGLFVILPWSGRSRFNRSGLASEPKVSGPPSLCDSTNRLGGVAPRTVRGVRGRGWCQGRRRSARRPTRSGRRRGRRPSRTARRRGAARRSRRCARPGSGCGRPSRGCG